MHPPYIIAADAFSQIFHHKWFDFYKINFESQILYQISLSIWIHPI